MRSEEEIQKRLDAFWVKSAQLMKRTDSITGFLANMALLSVNTIAINELQWVLEKSKTVEMP